MSRVARHRAFAVRQLIAAPGYRLGYDASRQIRSVRKGCTAASQGDDALVDWGTVTNIQTDNANTASLVLTAGQTGEKLSMQDFDFDAAPAVPDGATVLGVVIGLRGYYAGTAPTVALFKLLDADGAVWGTDRKAELTLPTAIATPTIGEPLNLAGWGVTPTRANIVDADFGCQLQFSLASGSVAILLAYMWIEVHYRFP